MEPSNIQKIYTSVLVAIAAVMVLLIAWFNNQTLHSQREANQIWLNYANEEVKINASLTRLYHEIGYGGFIHHFKNYLIRRDEEDLQRLKNDAIAVRQDLDELAKVLSHPNEIAALDQIDYVFSQYIGHIEEIFLLNQQNLSIAQIDRLVKTDDTPAILALEALSNSVKHRLNLAQINAQQQITFSHQLSLFSWFTLLPVLGFSFLIIYFLRRSNQYAVQAEQGRQAIQHLLNTTPDPMIFSNPKGKIVRSNKAAQAFFGYSDEEMNQLDVEALIPQQFRQQHVQFREVFQQEPSTRDMNQGIPLKALTANNEEADVQIRIGFWDNPQTPLYIASIRDVSQEVKDQEQLRTSHKQIADTMQKLQHATHHLAEAEKMASLGTLVAGVSHEINTPLGVSLTAVTHIHDQSAQLLTDYQDGKLSEQQLQATLADITEASSITTHNLQRAAKLINTFKQIAVDQSHADLRSFYLVEYIQDTLSSLKPSIKQQPIQLRFEYDRDVEVTTFPGAISQVINNLVMNALQHAFDKVRGGAISLQLSTHEETVVLRISDNGHGMNEDTLQHIYDPFFTTARSQGGSGLGMNIVYNLVYHTLQGEMFIESRLNHGTDILITLPQQLDPEKIKNYDPFAPLQFKEVPFRNTEDHF